MSSFRVSFWQRGWASVFCGRGEEGSEKEGMGEGGRGSCKEEGKKVSELLFFLALEATKWNLAASKLP